MDSTRREAIARSGRPGIAEFDCFASVACRQGEFCLGPIGSKRIHKTLLVNSRDAVKLPTTLKEVKAIFRGFADQEERKTGPEPGPHERKKSSAGHSITLNSQRLIVTRQQPFRRHQQIDIGGVLRRGRPVFLPAALPPRGDQFVAVVLRIQATKPGSAASDCSGRSQIARRFHFGSLFPAVLRHRRFEELVHLPP
jgi:hypothetical protein